MNALEVAEVDAWWSRVQALTVLILLRILVFLRTKTIRICARLQGGLL